MNNEYVNGDYCKHMAMVRHYQNSNETEIKVVTAISTMEELTNEIAAASSNVEQKFDDHDDDHGNNIDKLMDDMIEFQNRISRDIDNVDKL